MKVDGSIEALRSTAARDPKAAVKEAAKQFEALFMQQLMKSMRDASMSSGMLDNEGSKLGTEMLDGQFAVKMTGLPGGLADAIARHLERQMTSAAAAAGVPSAPAPLKGEPSLSGKQAAFVQQHLASARRAEAATGIPANFIVAQAAHESGWGRSEITGADGTPSHNLFGIKAGASWRGAVAETTTTEVIDGVPRKVTARFRAYASYAEAFDDYARLLAGNRRYAEVIENAASAEGFAQGLQRAGYATDPQYADKLTRVINTTLRVQRSIG
jgi:flagellar protein FlgJ